MQSLTSINRKKAALMPKINQSEESKANNPFVSSASPVNKIAEAARKKLAAQAVKLIAK